MKKKIFVSVLFLLSVFLGFSSTAFAWGSTFSDASDRDFGSTTYSYLSPLEVNVYHYEVSSTGQGAYNLYSTGYTPLLGYLYERNGIWPFEHYDLIADLSDDTNTSFYNFRYEVDLDNYEDYYVKVMGYSNSTTGGYYLYFAPNQDKLYNEHFATWTRNAGYEFAFFDKYTYVDQATNLYAFYASMDPLLNPTIWDIVVACGLAVAQVAVEAYLINTLGLTGTTAFIASIATAVIVTAISTVVTPLVSQMYQNQFISASNGYWYNDNGINRLMLVDGVNISHGYDPQLGTLIQFSTWTSGIMYGQIRTRGVWAIHDQY